MKKTLIAVLAIAGVVACNKTEVVEVSQAGAIVFENAFVDNATRAANYSTTTESLDAFTVYGFVNEVDGVVFNNELVSKTDAGWTYENTQYWAPNNSYYFAALAPVGGYKLTPVATTDEAKLGVGVVKFTNEDGKADLIYAAETRTTGATIDAQPAAVKFTFNHLLSKVKFSFTNGFKNENASIAVSNIVMTVPASASINLATADWWTEGGKWYDYAGEINLALGNMVQVAEGETADETPARIEMNKKGESADELHTIPTPATQSYEVTFKVDLYMGETVAYTANLKTTITGAALEIGKCYNFHATLDANNIVPGEDGKLYEITFDAPIVKDWVDGNGYDGGVIDTEAEVTETPAE